MYEDHAPLLFAEQKVTKKKTHLYEVCGTYYVPKRISRSEMSWQHIVWAFGPLAQMPFGPSRPKCLPWGPWPHGMPGKIKNSGLEGQIPANEAENGQYEGDLLANQPNIGHFKLN